VNIKNKTIFITGGAGFIGTALISRLVKNNKIVVYDTLERNALKGAGLSDHPNITLIKGNILDEEKLGRAIRGSNIIMHLAAIAGIDTVIKNSTVTMEVNMICLLYTSPSPRD